MSLEALCACFRAVGQGASISGPVAPMVAGDLGSIIKVGVRPKREDKVSPNR